MQVVTKQGVCPAGNALPMLSFLIEKRKPRDARLSHGLASNNVDLLGIVLVALSVGELNKVVLVSSSVLRAINHEGDPDSVFDLPRIPAGCPSRESA